MEFLAEGRRTLDEFLPGFDAQIVSIPLAEMEARDSDAIEMFRSAGEAGLRVDAAVGNRGAGPRAAEKFLVSGSKKPCSLSRSMDVLTASLAVISEAPDAEPEFAVALVPAGSPGLEVSDFWGSSVLAGAQSEAVTLSDVPVDPNLVVAADSDNGVQTASFLWFELLITASYIGMASSLVEQLGGMAFIGGEEVSYFAAARPPRPQKPQRKWKRVLTTRPPATSK